MMNKIFGVKNITHLLYGFLICMPMLSILARTCYVAVNKNAKDSYSNQLIEQTQSINNGNTIMDGDIVTFNYINNTITGTTSTERFKFYEISFNPTDYGFNDLPYNYVAIDTRTNANFVFLYVDNAYYFKDIWGSQLKTLTIKADGQQGGATTTQTTVCYKTTYTTQKLDNAFEYSLSQFTKDNNLGNVDLFSWFTNLFLDQTNPTNQLYLGFVNWYLNYTLLVSSGYLLFLTLIWFVNYVRRILDKSMNQEYGGF